jgi:hypothetical protein
MIQQSPDFRIEGHAVRSSAGPPHKHEKMLSAFGNIDWSAVTYTTAERVQPSEQISVLQHVSVEADGFLISPSM